MAEKSNTRRRFTIRTAFFLTLCVAGVLAGYRIGHRQGYNGGFEKRLSEQPTTKVYDLSDYWYAYDPTTRTSKRVSPNHPEAYVDYDTFIELITTTIHPATWDFVGGPGSIAPGPNESHLVVHQQPYVHEDIAKLFESLQGKDMEAVADLAAAARPAEPQNPLGLGTGQFPLGADATATEPPIEPE